MRIRGGVWQMAAAESGSIIVITAARVIGNYSGENDKLYRITAVAATYSPARHKIILIFFLHLHKNNNGGDVEQRRVNSNRFVTRKL